MILSSSALELDMKTNMNINNLIIDAAGNEILLTLIVDKDIYTCKVCEIDKKDYTTHKVAIPYAFKLLLQELQTINILPRIKVERNVYND